MSLCITIPYLNGHTRICYPPFRHSPSSGTGRIRPHFGTVPKWGPSAGTGCPFENWVPYPNTAHGCAMVVPQRRWICPVLTLGLCNIPVPELGRCQVGPRHMHWHLRASLQETTCMTLCALPIHIQLCMRQSLPFTIISFSFILEMLGSIVVLLMQVHSKRSWIW